MNQDTFEFTIYIIHACAEKWKQLPSQVFYKLSKTNCINLLLVPHYDILHTQGTQYIVNDIENFLSSRGEKI